MSTAWIAGDAGEIQDLRQAVAAWTRRKELAPIRLLQQRRDDIAARVQIGGHEHKLGEPRLPEVLLQHLGVSTAQRSAAPAAPPARRRESSPRSRSQTASAPDSASIGAPNSRHHQWPAPAGRRSVAPEQDDARRGDGSPAAHRAFLPTTSARSSQTQRQESLTASRTTRSATSASRQARSLVRLPRVERFHARRAPDARVLPQARRRRQSPPAPRRPRQSPARPRRRS